MRNLKLGNILIIILFAIVLFFIMTDITRIISEGYVEKIDSLNTELIELRNETKVHDSMNVEYNATKRKNFYEHILKFKNSLKIAKQENLTLRDSIESLHISYMNGSYLKEHYDSTITYWYMNYNYVDSVGQKYYSNKIWKFDGNFSFTDFITRMEKGQKIDQYKQFINLNFYHQVSEKEYFKWKNE